jgi:hypothetical protein
MFHKYTFQHWQCMHRATKMALKSWKVPWIAKLELLLLADAEVAGGRPREYWQESEANAGCKDEWLCRIPGMGEQFGGRVERM